MNNIENKAKKLQAEYHKKWRKKNPNKVKAINRRYWLKKAKQELEKDCSLVQNK